MTRLVDLSGQTFWRLTVLDRAGRDETGKTLWRCLCGCGRVTTVTGLNLKSGNTKSCGCLKRRKGAANPKYKEPDPSSTKRRKRTGAAYKYWRLAIAQRCPVCLKCGAENIQSHHVLGYSEYPALALEPRNGVSLCDSCHLEYHMKHGRRSGFGPDSLRVFVAGPGSDVMTSVLLRNGIADLEKARHFLDLLIELERKNSGHAEAIGQAGNVGRAA